MKAVLQTAVRTAASLHTFALRIGILALAVCVVVSAPRTSSAQVASSRIDNRVLRIEVDKINALASAIDELSKLCRCPIAFEEPPWSHSDDISTSIEGGRAARHVKRDKLVIERTIDEPLTTESVVAVIQEILASYEGSGHSGRFRIEQDGLIRVIPTLAKNAAGIETTVKPILDTEITLTEDQRTPGQWLEAISEAVERASGVRMPAVFVGSPMLMGNRVRFSATSEPARSVVARLLATLPVKAAWRVHYNPNNGEYSLGLKFVQRFR